MSKFVSDITAQSRHRWLDKLEKDGLIAFEGERITPLSQRNKVGD